MLLKYNKLPFQLEHLSIDNDFAVAELTVNWPTKKGTIYFNHYCWVCRFADEKIVEVRAYMDSIALRDVINKR